MVRACCVAVACAVGVAPVSAQVVLPPDLPTPDEIVNNLSAFPATAQEFFQQNPNFKLPVSPFASPDFDNDTVEDLIFPALGFGLDQPVIGMVAVDSGWDANELFTFTSTEPNDLFAWKAIGVPDLNGDGFAEMVISAPASNADGNEAGRVYVYSGQTGLLLYTLTGQSPLGGFGWSVDSAGDVNADGFNDLIVGEPMGNQPGRAYVFFGGPTSGAPVDRSTATADMTFTGEALLDGFGASVAGAGDVDGDGQDDLLIGAPFNDAAFVDVNAQAGAVYVYSGATGQLLINVKSDQPGQFLGWSVSSAGDLNADGKADVIMGALGQLTGDIQTGFINDSRAFVVFGSAKTKTLTSSFADLTLAPTEPGDILFGTSIERGNDVNDDGLREVLVTAFSVQDGLPRVYIYSGLDGAFLSSFLLTGSQPPATPGGGDPTGVDVVHIVLDNFGSNNATAAEGDLNGDGIVDSFDLVIALNNLNNQANGPPAPSGSSDCLGVIPPDGSDPCADGDGPGGGGGPPANNPNPGGDACANLNQLLNQAGPLTPEQCDELVQCIIALFNDLQMGLENTPEGMAFTQTMTTRNTILATARSTKRSSTKITLAENVTIAITAVGVGAVTGAYGGSFAPGPGTVFGGLVGAGVGAIGGTVTIIVNTVTSSNDLKSMFAMFDLAGDGLLALGTFGVSDALINAGHALAQAKAALKALMEQAKQQLDDAKARWRQDCQQMP